MAGVCRFLEDAAGIPQAPFRVDVLDGWEHGPSDVLGCLHHTMEGLEVVNIEIPISGRDATGQDSLDGAVVVFGEDPGCRAKFLQPP